MKTKDVITREEYIFDLEEAALRVAENNRDHAVILKNLDPMSTDLTKYDAITIVDEYVNQDRREELEYYINNNSILSGLLQQNLFDYLQLKREDKMNLDSLNYTDEMFNSHGDLKSQLIFQMMVEEQEISNFFINREELKTVMLQNTMCMYMLFANSNINFKALTRDKTQNEKIKMENVAIFRNLPIEEQKKLKDIYMSNTEVYGAQNINSRTDISVEQKQQLIEVETIEAIRARKNTNDRIARMLLEKGETTNIDDLQDMISGLGDDMIKFLTNMYIISRSTKNNIDVLNNVTYSATKDQTHVFNLLSDNELINRLNNNIKKVA